jgi:methyl-accepting chemotaxis protein
LTKHIIINTIKNVNSFYSDMQELHEVIRFNYSRISESIQAEVNFLSELSERTDDQRFIQSITEVIYSLSDLSDMINRQRRNLKPRNDAE